MIKIENILFWILIFVIVGVIIWMLFGSLSLESSLIAIIIFVSASEILLWKSLFAIDKRSAFGFETRKMLFSYPVCFNPQKV